MLIDIRMCRTSEFFAQKEFVVLQSCNWHLTNTLHEISRMFDMSIRIALDVEETLCRMIEMRYCFVRINNWSSLAHVISATFIFSTAMTRRVSLQKSWASMRLSRGNCSGEWKREPRCRISNSPRKTFGLWIISCRFFQRKHNFRPPHDASNVMA